MEEGPSLIFKVGMEPCIFLDKAFCKAEEFIKFCILKEEVTAVKDFIELDHAFQAGHQVWMFFPGVVKEVLQNWEQAWCQMLAFTTFGTQVCPMHPR